ncbi:hypothetical protein [Burkholderia vietnamiensis]|uniref:hypothetical protein n=1 Tax=Burkholderia vietnamiensis TaxID=60552 RepID=UPI000A50DD25|nr:hypothetical protein [Burkholderia vietnamiensis]
MARSKRAQGLSQFFKRPSILFAQTNTSAAHALLTAPARHAPAKIPLIVQPIQINRLIDEPCAPISREFRACIAYRLRGNAFPSSGC